MVVNFARNHKLAALVFETRVGEGKLLVCSIDLPGLADKPAARQMLSNPLTYAGEASPDPKAELDAAMRKELFSKQ